nr:hypothetical protein [Pseudomonas aegrilactucae]
MIARLCMAGVLALGLNLAWAEEPEPLALDENDTPLYEVNFVDTELGEFIDSVSRITGTTFIVDPRVKGKVTVRTSIGMTARPFTTSFWPSCAPRALLPSTCPTAA